MVSNTSVNLGNTWINLDPLTLSHSSDRIYQQLETLLCPESGHARNCRCSKLQRHYGRGIFKCEFLTALSIDTDSKPSLFAIPTTPTITVHGNALCQPASMLSLDSGHDSTFMSTGSYIISPQRLTNICHRIN